MDQVFVTEFEIGTTRYGVTRLDARRQFNIAKRLAPIVGDLQALFAKLPTVPEGQRLPDGVVAKITDEVLPVLLDAVAKIPDADSDYVIYHALSVVRFQAPGAPGWARAVTGGDPTTMVVAAPDLQELPGLLRVVWAVLEVHLANFTSAPALSSIATTPLTRVS